MTTPACGCCAWCAIQVVPWPSGRGAASPCTSPEPVLFPHFAGKTPFLCQSAMPFAAYPITLGVVVHAREEFDYVREPIPCEFLFLRRP